MRAEKRGAAGRRILVGRIRVLVLTLLAALACLSCGEKPPPVVGVLNPSLLCEPLVEGFKFGLYEMDLEIGMRTKYLIANIGTEPDSLATEAKALVDGKADVILAVTAKGAQAAREAAKGTNTPVVFALVPDPVGLGLAQSIAKPGGNLTGIAAAVGNAQNDSNRLEWFLKLAPAVRCIYVLHDTSDPQDPSILEALRVAAKARDGRGEVRLVFGAATDEASARSLARTIPSEADAVFLTASPVFLSPPVFFEIAQAARGMGTPLCVPNPDGVQQGAFMGYGPDYNETGRQAARLAVRILRGAKPAGMPVETPRKLLAVNLAAAKAVKLDVRPNILRLVDVIVHSP